MFSDLPGDVAWREAESIEHHLVAGLPSHPEHGERRSVSNRRRGVAEELSNRFSASRGDAGGACEGRVAAHKGARRGHVAKRWAASSGAPEQNRQSGESRAPWRCRDSRVRVRSWRRIQKKICTFLGAKVSQLSSAIGGAAPGTRRALYKSVALGLAARAPGTHRSSRRWSSSRPEMVPVTSSNSAAAATVRWGCRLPPRRDHLRHGDVDVEALRVESGEGVAEHADLSPAVMPEGGHLVVAHRDHGDGVVPEN